MTEELGRDRESADRQVTGSDLLALPRHALMAIILGLSQDRPGTLAALYRQFAREPQPSQTPPPGLVPVSGGLLSRKGPALHVGGETVREGDVLRVTEYGDRLRDCVAVRLFEGSVRCVAEGRFTTLRAGREVTLLRRTDR